MSKKKTKEPGEDSPSQRQRKAEVDAEMISRRTHSKLSQSRCRGRHESLLDSTKQP